jgi:hypothetical protein
MNDDENSSHDDSKGHNTNNLPKLKSNSFKVACGR